MSNGEDYILEVLRTVQKNLHVDLKTEQTTKFDFMFEKFKSSQLLRGEIALLQRVENYIKPAVAMEWILARESNSKFKNYSKRFASDVRLLESEFRGSFSTQPNLKKEKTLTELIDKNLLIGFSRFTEIINSLPSKSPSERKAVIVLLMMVAKSSIEMAKAKKNSILQNLFESLISFVNFVESKGEIESVKVAHFLSDIGEKLTDGMKSDESGAKIINTITSQLANPKNILG